MYERNVSLREFSVEECMTEEGEQRQVNLKGSQSCVCLVRVLVMPCAKSSHYFFLLDAEKILIFFTSFFTTSSSAGVQSGHV